MSRAAKPSAQAEAEYNLMLLSLDRITLRMGHEKRMMLNIRGTLL